jgi:hypothetical protein
MKYSNIDLAEYAESLFSAQGFDEAFKVFEQEVLKFGFEGVLYTYIPRVMLDSNFPIKPVYKVSHQYNPKYLAHYIDTRFDKHDPLIKAVQDGVTKPIDWWSEVNGRCMEADKASREVIATLRDYGISNGITLPLMFEEKGIAGASFITSESISFDPLKDENIDWLKLCTNMFHSLVLSSSTHTSYFIKPVFNDLNETEKSFLKKLARGKTPTQISVELNKSEKYLEQVMLRIRRKLSGVSADSSPLLNRNQVLYYAGLMDLIENLD